jgi:hypothetical protein
MNWVPACQVQGALIAATPLLDSVEMDEPAQRAARVPLWVSSLLAARMLLPVPQSLLE